MTTPFLRKALVAGAAIAAMLVGCTNDNPEQLLASARAKLSKGEAKAAIIELKTALQQQPNSPQARLALGLALLEEQEPVAAAVELRKALGLNQPRDQVIPVLAKAMLDQGQYRALLSEFGDIALDDKAAHASLKTTLGWAYLHQLQAVQAEAAFARAREASPDHVPTIVAQARMQALRGDLEGASRTVEALIAAGRADAEAWVLKGDLLMHDKASFGQSIDSYRNALKLAPADISAHGGIVMLYLTERDLKSAAAQVADMGRVRPSHPTTRYFEAQLAFEKRDYKASREIVAGLLKVAPEHPLFNYLAGALELASGSAEVARSHLAKTLVAAPTNIGARRMLGATLLRTDESNKALGVLGPLLAQSPPDSVALALAGEAHLQLGDMDAAVAHFSKAAKADPSAVNRTALARTRLAKGDALGAVSDFQQIASSDTSALADLELVNAQLVRRDFDAALAAVDALERKMKSRPLPWQLRGLAHLGKTNLTEARSSFEKALSIEPGFFPAAASLAAIDVADGKPKAAEQRFETLLKAQPGHLRATLTLAQLKARHGADQSEVAELLIHAVRLHPTDASAHLALIEHHLKAKQAEPALSAARRAEAAFPTQAAILDAVGRAQLAAGQKNQALATFNKLSALSPDQAAPHLRLAAASLASRDMGAAIKSLERAAQLAPDSPALPHLFALLLQTGRFADALTLARQVQRRAPMSSVGEVLEGDAMMASRDIEAAIAAYKRGTEKAEPTIAATRLHALLSRTGRAAVAAQFAQRWTTQHPKDFGFVLYQGDSALGSGEFLAAERAYRKVLELQPDNVMALSNVAWVMAKTNRPGALAYAEKANGLQPDQPLLLDTLAFVLAAEKQLDRALSVQKRALVLAPENNALRLGLARLYAQAGQKKQAREELESLAKLGETFAQHAEVKRLIATL